MDSFRRDLLKLSPLALAGFAPGFGQSARPGQGGSPMLFDVRAFGATGTGRALDTPAINAAIDAAAAAGGGRVFVPAGTYLCFSIRLKSNVEIFLAQGAVILAADSPKPGETTGQMGGRYDAAEPNTAWDAYQDYGHNHWHNSLMWGEGLHDVAITGPGLIYGKGLSFGAGPGVGPGRPPGAERGAGFGPERPAGGQVPPAQAPAAQVRPPRGDYPMYQAEQAGVGNKAIALKNCHNVLLKDFSILKGGHFGLLLTGVDNLTIDNLRIDTDRDGMDIDCCKNVHVSNCTVNSPWDDGICPKSSYALGYPRATENCTITNCVVTGYYELGTMMDGTFRIFPADARGAGRTGRIKCGTESNGGFKNITISNCVLEGCNGIALESEDGALCEDITISSITCRNLINGPLFFRLGARLRGPKETTKVGTLKRIMVANVASSNSLARLPNILSGIPGYPIEDVKIANFYMQHQGGVGAEAVGIVPPEAAEKYPDPGMFGAMPAQGFYLRHIKNLEMSHVEIAPMAADARPSFVLEDVNRVDFLAVTAPTPGAFGLRRATDVRIQFSRAAKDTTLATAEGQTI